MGSRGGAQTTAKCVCVIVAGSKESVVLVQEQSEIMVLRPPSAEDGQNSVRLVDRILVEDSTWRTPHLNTPPPKFI